MDRREPPGVRYLSHPHALPRDATVSPDGSARPDPASRLESLRHRPRCLSAQAHDPAGTRARICLDISAPVLACFDLAASSARLSGYPALPGDVVPLQALQSLLAPADQARPGESGVETPGGDDALAACALSETAG